jgi:hypothetical protein
MGDGGFPLRVLVAVPPPISLLAVQATLVRRIFFAMQSDSNLAVAVGLVIPLRPHSGC